MYSFFGLIASLFAVSAVVAVGVAAGIVPTPSHQRDGVDEGGHGLGVPTRRPVCHGLVLLQRMGGQSDPGKQAHQDRCGSGDGAVGPSALGLHAQMGPYLLVRYLKLPS